MTDPTAEHDDARVGDAPDPAAGTAGAVVAVGSAVGHGVAGARHGAAVGGRIGGAHGAVVGAALGAGRAALRSQHRGKLLIGLLCLLIPNLLIGGMLALGSLSVAAAFGTQLDSLAMSRGRAAGAVSGDQAAGWAEASARSGVHWAVLAALEADTTSPAALPDGSDAPAPNPDPAAALDVGVGSWNVLKTNSVAGIVGGLAALAAAGADVIGLQEVTPGSKRAALRERLGPDWGMTDADNAVPIVWRRARVDLVAEHSRQVLGPTHVEGGSGGTLFSPRSVQWSEFAARGTGARFAVVNHHLLPGIEAGGRPDPDRPRRVAAAEKQMDTALAVADRFRAAGVATMVTGDHNIAAAADAKAQDPRFPYIGYARHGLYSNWRSLGYPRGGTHAGGRLIDYVFASTALAAPVRQAILPRHGSDHNPVVVELSNRSGARTGAASADPSAAKPASVSGGGPPDSATAPDVPAATGVGPYRLDVDRFDEQAARYGLDPLTTDEAARRVAAGAALGRLFVRLLADADPSITASSLTAGVVSAETPGGTVLRLGTGGDDLAAQQRVRTAYVQAFGRLPVDDAEARVPGLFELALGYALGNPPTVCTGRAATGGEPPDGGAGTVTPLPARVTATTATGTPVRLDAVQIRHAAEIIGYGRRLRLARRDIQAALMTALQESRLLMYANANVPGSLNHPHDAVGHDHDSVNLFQQRPGAWGSVAQLMQAPFAIGMFYGGPSKPKPGGPPGLLDIPGRGTKTLGELAQAVQVSAFPGAYDQWAPVAAAILDRIGGVDTGSAGNAAGCSAATTPDAGCPPTTLQAERQGLSPDAVLVTRCVAAQFPTIGAVFSYPGHQPTMRQAVDIMIPGFDTPQGRALGDRVATWIRDHHRELGVQYVIWWGRIWNVERDPEGWRRYFDADNPDPNRSHHSHVHVSVYGDRGTGPTNPPGGTDGLWADPTGGRYKITCGFGCYPGHTGADYPDLAGTPVLNVFGGTVIRSESLPASGGPCTALPICGGAAHRSYGNFIVVRSSSDPSLTAWYAHLSQRLVPVGATVTRGQEIGLSGFEGHVIPAGPRGAHLHFEIRRNGTPVDPAPLLAVHHVASGHLRGS
ncbi:peptidoglycan DD-metalloendopeptidase family protein [Microlunatus ginsengisoli]|uniref:peptidoglycan DD-metalloendopeptidase family protein n=1 Tax=Microlunatus ginsengisoli TaxID=363863 RepID=UPI0031D3FE45